MTKWGFHPTVILRSSYGDLMVWVLFGTYFPEKCIFICVYQKIVVPLHPKRKRPLIAIAKAKAVFAGEYASVITKMDSETGDIEGFRYQNNWANPTEEEAVRMEEEYGFVAATGSFGVSAQSRIW